MSQTYPDLERLFAAETKLSRAADRAELRAAARVFVAMEREIADSTPLLATCGCPYSRHPPRRNADLVLHDVCSLGWPKVGRDAAGLVDLPVPCTAVAGSAELPPDAPTGLYLDRKFDRDDIEWLEMALGQASQRESSAVRTSQLMLVFAAIERDPRTRDAFLQAMNESVLPLCRRVRLSKLAFGEAL